MSNVNYYCKVASLVLMLLGLFSSAYVSSKIEEKLRKKLNASDHHLAIARKKKTTPNYVGFAFFVLAMILSSLSWTNREREMIALYFMMGMAGPVLFFMGSLAEASYVRRTIAGFSRADFVYLLVPPILFSASFVIRAYGIAWKLGGVQS